MAIIDLVKCRIDPSHSGVALSQQATLDMDTAHSQRDPGNTLSKRVYTRARSVQGDTHLALKTSHC